MANKAPKPACVGCHYFGFVGLDKGCFQSEAPRILTAGKAQCTNQRPIGYQGEPKRLKLEGCIAMMHILGMVSCPFLRQIIREGTNAA